MPKGPKGQKRPADVIGNAVMVMKIATGELEEQTPATEGKEYARKGGLKGGKARAKALTPKQRAEIARLAAEARWKKSWAAFPPSSSEAFRISISIERSIGRVIASSSGLILFQWSRSRVNW
jgi:hypothetical protein